MNEQQRSQLDNINRTDIGVCPKCGILFVKSVKGKGWGLVSGKGFFCPVCYCLVCK